LTPKQVLEQSETVAVVGLSRDPWKAAHAVPASLRAAGFRIIPVNPYATTVLGETAYGRLEDIPVAVDLVVVFRPAQEAPNIARQAVKIGAKALWLQTGIRSDKARSIAKGAGLAYVEDRCTGVERAIYSIRKGEVK
jgi:predicted CoA-binding protein